MATYTLTVVIDQRVLAMGSSDNLCLARKVNGRFTTVFQDASTRPRGGDTKQLLEHTQFQWQNKYRVYAAASDHRHGMLVQAATDSVEIAPGNQTIFEHNQFSSATPASPDDLDSPGDSFMAKNIPSSLHVSVECLASGKWVTIFVDPNQHVGTMNARLTPQNEYMLFWSDRVSTGTMIDAERSSNPFTFSFDGGNTSKTVRFGYATANQPSGGEDARFYAA